MYNIYKLLFIAFITQLSFNSFGNTNEYYEGYIGFIMIEYNKKGTLAQHNGKATFQLLINGNLTGPGCEGSGNRFAVDTATEEGKAVYSALLVSKAQKQKVRIGASGTCDATAWGDDYVEWILLL